MRYVTFIAVIVDTETNDINLAKAKAHNARDAALCDLDEQKDYNIAFDAVNTMDREANIEESHSLDNHRREMEDEDDEFDDEDFDDDED